ncbi:MAG: isoprenylcysteine carboxylmethyltransferase family protein [Candidatus Altiarchaeota archaeon]|nr:isoprenylcysteine carboxylmethyltransferase family protein [Candidatus Altiarchaeota archaeon]
MEESLYKTLLGVLLMLFFAIRAFYFRKKNKPRETRKKLRERTLIAVNFFGMVFFPLIYVFTDYFDGFMMGLPDTLRTAGAALYLLTIAFFAWIHSSLGSNWSMTLEVGREHKLVKSGPYRYIRHPMYLAFYLMMAAQLLLSSNWLVGLFGLISWDIHYRIRIKDEEDMMIEEFGDEYKKYMKRTGRLLPRI